MGHRPPLFLQTVLSAGDKREEASVLMQLDESDYLWNILKKLSPDLAWPSSAVFLGVY